MRRRLRWRHVLQGGAQVAFGVDQEVAFHHHALAFVQTLQHFDTVAVALAGGDRPWREAARRHFNQCDLALAGIDQRRTRDGQPFAAIVPGQCHVAEQARPQPPVGVRQRHPHRQRAAGRIQHGLQETHLAIERLAGQRRRGEAGGLAQPHLADLRGRHVHRHPHHGQVGQPQQGVAGDETRALHDGFFHDHAAGRRGDGKVARRQVGDVLQLVGTDAPVQQAALGGVAQALHRLQAGSVAAAQLTQRRIGHAVVFLRGQQLRAVHGRQRLPALHRHAGLVGLQGVHPAVEARGDHVLAGFIDGNRAAGLQAGSQWLPLYRLGAHAEGLDLLRRQRHRAGCGIGFVLGIHRDVVHAHLVLFRHRRGVGQAHRVAVVQRLARCGCSCGGGSCGFRQPAQRDAAAQRDDQAGGDQDAVGMLHGVSPSRARTLAAPSCSSRVASSWASRASCQSFKASSRALKSTSPT